MVSLELLLDNYFSRGGEVPIGIILSTCILCAYATLIILILKFVDGCCWSDAQLDSIQMLLWDYSEHVSCKSFT